MNDKKTVINALEIALKSKATVLQHGNEEFLLFDDNLFLNITENSLFAILDDTINASKNDQYLRNIECLDDQNFWHLYNNNFELCKEIYFL